MNGTRIDSKDARGGGAGAPADAPTAAGALTEQTLAAIEARAAAATPGPWRSAWDDPEFPGRYDADVFLEPLVYAPAQDDPQAWLVVGAANGVPAGARADAAFIVGARTDVPALLAAARQCPALRAEVQRLRAAIEKAAGRILEAQEMPTLVRGLALAAIVVDLRDDARGTP